MTRMVFVAGWPVAHSRSPLIHRFWLKRYRIAGEYRREAVRPEDFSAFLADIVEKGYVGGNVTLPHKEAAFQACAETTPVASRLEAVNTLWLEDGRLCGDNTDVYGFTANLDEKTPEWRRGSRGLVIGAGGAARAVLQALIDANYKQVLVVNRTPARGQALASHFGSPVLAGGLDQLRDAMAEADLIVNATSAGLHGEPPLDVPWAAASSSAIVSDLIYVPLVTPFLAGAHESRLRIVNGLGMLLHQAVPGFERWFGVHPAVDAELRDLVMADIRG